MVKRRPASKRQSLKQRYNVDHKIKEHNRKLKKEMRKNPDAHRKLGKDPGIPNLNPFKAELLAKMQRSTRLVKASVAVRQRRATELALRRSQTEAQKMRSLVSNAQSRADAFGLAEERAEVAAATSAMLAAPGDIRAARAAENSRRAFYRQLRSVVAKADIILEVLDARDPLACRAPELEAFILSLDSSKKVVLVLNKIDLVPPVVVRQWLDYLRRSFPTVPFKASTQKQRNNLSAAGGARVNQAARSGEAVTGSGSAGSDILLQLIKNYSRSHDLKRAVTVGVIGYPNVGKSSIINSLKRSRAVGVSPVPGFTKTLQEVQLDAKVTLLDCPGIIFDDSFGAGGLDDGGAGLLLRNCISVESIPDPEVAVAGILRRCSPDMLMSLYSIPHFAEAGEFLRLIAIKRGKLVRGGDPDLTAAARSVLQDWNSGGIPFFTVPPTAAPIPMAAASSASASASSASARAARASGMEDGDSSAAIVTEWSKEFDIEGLERAEQVSVFGKVQPVFKDDAFVSLQSRGLASTRLAAAALAATDEDAGDIDEDDDDDDGEADDDSMGGDVDDDDDDEMDDEEEEDEEDDEDDEDAPMATPAPRRRAADSTPTSRPDAAAARMAAESLRAQRSAVATGVDMERIARGKASAAAAAGGGTTVGRASGSVGLASRPLISAEERARNPTEGRDRKTALKAARKAERRASARAASPAAASSSSSSKVSGGGKQSYDFDEFL